MDKLTEHDRAVARDLIAVVAERGGDVGTNVLRTLEGAGFAVVKRTPSVTEDKT